MNILHVRLIAVFSFVRIVNSPNSNLMESFIT